MKNITKEQMDNMTGYLIDNVFQNPKFVFANDEGETDFLLDVIATLHNYLYNEVCGDPYDYMFHWYNKLTGNVDINDDIFGILEEKEK